MSKKETEIQVLDSSDGVELFVAKKKIARIQEKDGKFIVFSASDDIITHTKTYADAEEEAIRSYNLTV